MKKTLSEAVKEMKQQNCPNTLGQTFCNVIAEISDIEIRLILRDQAIDLLNNMIGVEYQKSETNRKKLTKHMIEKFTDLFRYVEVIGRNDPDIFILKHWAWSKNEMPGSEPCKNGERSGLYYANHYMQNQAWQSWLSTKHIILHV